MKKGLIAYFAGNPVAANLLMLFLIIGGVVSGYQIAVQSYPALDLRTVTVTVASPGSSPKEVEEDINRRIEERVIGLTGVERVVGTAQEGLGRVYVEMATFADADTVLNDVQNAVDSIENFPPLNAEQSEVELARVELEVMTLAVSSPVVDEDNLRHAADDLRNGLLELPSISQVTLFGTRDREISIELSEEELRRHRLTLSEVANVVQRASFNLTFGELRTAAGGVVLHTVSKRAVGEEFEDIPLLTRLDGTIITLGDVAEIRDGFVDEDVVSEVDGEPAIFVRVDSDENQSIADMAQDIKRWLADYRAPQGITISIWNNSADPAMDRLSQIMKNGVIGALLVFLCLILVFDLRIATWITVGIPLSFVGSLLFFGPAGLTMDTGTIFAFFLLVGIVVDDAVVVGESIATERESGKGALEASVAGARAMLGPITVGVLTTILAFVPFLFVTAGNYQIVNVFPYVALFVLAVSLVEAFLILPAHLSHERRWSLPPLSDLQAFVSGRLEGFRDRIVGPAVSWSVNHVVSTLVCGLVIVLVSLLLVRTDQVRVILFDRDTIGAESIQANLELPVGSPFGATVAAAERFADAARAMNDQLEGTPVKSVSIVVGNTVAHRHRQVNANQSHLASVRLELNSRPIRKTAPKDIEQLWLRTIGDISDIEHVNFRSSRIQDKPSIAYALIHDDRQVLEQAAAELESGMAEVPGIRAISDNLSPGKRHLEIHLTPAGKAAGLTPAIIGKQLRGNFHGVEVQRIQRGREEIKVVVRYPAERRRSLGELSSERIHRPGGGEIPLLTAARLTEKRELAVLNRIDGKQTVLVEAHTDISRITPGKARSLISADIIPELLERYPGLRIEKNGNPRDQAEMLETLGVLVPVVLIAMYALMAAFLRSYWKPLIAVAGIPIAFSGAVFGHWILGWDLTAMSLFGVIAVFGVIVNDTLVLLDRYNILRRPDQETGDRLPAIAAAAAAARYRFRAVFLTSLTTVLGLSPLVYERSDSLLFLVPFVISMLGGLMLSGVFILFFLPVLVMIVDGRQE